MKERTVVGSDEMHFQFRPDIYTRGPQLQVVKSLHRPVEVGQHHKTTSHQVNDRITEMWDPYTDSGMKLGLADRGQDMIVIIPF